MIGRDHRGRQRSAIGKFDHNRRRLGREVERTGNDVAIFRDDYPGGRAIADQHLPNAVETAHGFNSHNGRLDQSRRLLEGLLLQSIQLRILSI